MFKEYLMRFYHEFLWLLLRIYLLFSGSTAARAKLDLQPGCAYILAANHRSQLDAFLICAAIPLPVYHRLAPVRFMTHNAYFKPLIFRLFLKIGGGYPARPFRDLPYGLEYSTKILERGGTILIFPEGTRTLPGAVKAKRGVEVLAKIKNVEIIPIYLEWEKGRIFRKVHLVYGSPQSGANLSAQQIMETIYSLGDNRTKRLESKPIQT